MRNQSLKVAFPVGVFTFFVTLLLLTGGRASGQGALNFGNSLGGSTFRAPIFSPYLTNISLGTGFSLALYGGPTNSFSDEPIVLTLFTNPPQSFITTNANFNTWISNTVNGAAGTKFQIRVWDAQGAIVTNWNSLHNSTLNQTPLGGLNFTGSLNSTSNVPGLPGPILDLSIIDLQPWRPPNDRFATPWEVPATARGAGYYYTTTGATAETNEPPHHLSAATATLWWKWTPSYSGMVRVKAVRDGTGLPLEVFTGSGLESLRLVADNRGRYGKYGVSAFIRLTVTRGQTYYVRTDILPGQIVLGSSQNDSLLQFEPAQSPMMGEVNLSLKPRSDQKALAHVYAQDGRTPLVGSRYRAVLYAGKNPFKLYGLVPPRPFYYDDFVETSPSYAGLFTGMPVAVPAYAGQRIWVQVRVWDSYYGQTFGEAMENGSPIGTSRMLYIQAGSEAVGPAPLSGIGDFKLHAPTAEERRILTATSVEPQYFPGGFSN